MCVCVCVCIYIYTYACICMYIHIHVHTYICICISVYIHTHAHIFIYIYTHSLFTYIHIRPQKIFKQDEGMLIDAPRGRMQQRHRSPKQPRRQDEFARVATRMQLTHHVAQGCDTFELKLLDMLAPSAPCCRICCAVAAACLVAVGRAGSAVGGGGMEDHA